MYLKYLHSLHICRGELKSPKNQTPQWNSFNRILREFFLSSQNVSNSICLTCLPRVAKSNCILWVIDLQPHLTSLGSADQTQPQESHRGRRPNNSFRRDAFFSPSRPLLRMYVTASKSASFSSMVHKKRKLTYRCWCVIWNYCLFSREICNLTSCGLSSLNFFGWEK